MRSATARGSRLPERAELMSSSRRSSSARSCVRVSSRVEPMAVAAWSARIVRTRRSSGPNPSRPSLDRVMTPIVTASRRIGTTIIDSSTSSVPGIVCPRGSWLASLTRSGSPCSATQPVKPSPNRQVRSVHVDLFVGPDPALEGDRHDLFGRLHDVHPGVVVIDDLARLLDDDPPDLFGRGRPAESGRRCLEDLELGRPCGRLLEELGVRDGDRGVRREGRDEGHVAARPGARLARRRGQGADDPVVVDEWRDEVATDVQDAVVALEAEVAFAADVAEGHDLAGAQDLAHPALVAAEDGQPAGDLVGQTGPRGDLEPVVPDDPDRGHVGPEHALRLVDDGPEELGSVVRGGQPSGDRRGPYRDAPRARPRGRCHSPWSARRERARDGPFDDRAVERAGPVGPDQPSQTRGRHDGRSSGGRGRRGRRRLLPFRRCR